LQLQRNSDAAIMQPEQCMWAIETSVHEGKVKPSNAHLMSNVGVENESN